MVMVFHLGALLKPRVGRDEKQEQKCLVHQQDKTVMYFKIRIWLVDKPYL